MKGAGPAGGAPGGPGRGPGSVVMVSGPVPVGEFDGVGPGVLLGPGAAGGAPGGEPVGELGGEPEGVFEGDALGGVGEEGVGALPAGGALGLGGGGGGGGGGGVLPAGVTVAMPDSPCDLSVWVVHLWVLHRA